ncbi:MAG: type VI secretion system contractile sheath large subunit [Methylococcaceae bacterium]|nr:type VI secretion system contractile sheath large subunit [Methylococcaceae bacterium]
MPGQNEFIFNFGKALPESSFRSTPYSSMRILVLGNFSGRPNRGVTDNSEDLGNRSILTVDVDNFTAIMSRIAPNLSLQLGDAPETKISLTFRQIDDFHPDTLFKQLDLFHKLTQLRERLQNSESFEEAAAEFRQSIKMPVIEECKSAHAIVEENDAVTLERLLGERPLNRAQTSDTKAKTIASEYIKNIVAEYIVPDVAPYKDIYLQAVDDAISATMRQLLHHPDFQALEAAWRSLNMLVTSLETGENLSLHLLDVTKDELLIDLTSADGNLHSSKLYYLLVEQGIGTFGGEPWSLLVGNYTFSASAEDVTLLAALGVVSSHAGGPFIAAVDPKVLGCHSLVDTPDAHDWLEMKQEAAQRWQALRHSSSAQWLGLALPRLLTRLPYGHDTEAVDGFQFEEKTLAQGHEDFLWGNPAFYCALLIARSFTERGWSMQLGDYLEIDELPAYIFKQQGESMLQPCAEVCLSDKTMEKILNQGIMPFISHRSSNIVRLARFQSVAEPLKTLAGPWG